MATHTGEKSYNEYTESEFSFKRKNTGKPKHTWEFTKVRSQYKCTLLQFNVMAHNLILDWYMRPLLEKSHINACNVYIHVFRDNKDLLSLIHRREAFLYLWCLYYKSLEEIKTHWREAPVCTVSEASMILKRWVKHRREALLPAILSVRLLW